MINLSTILHCSYTDIKQAWQVLTSRILFLLYIPFAWNTLFHEILFLMNFTLISFHLLSDINFLVRVILTTIPATEYCRFMAYNILTSCLYSECNFSRSQGISLVFSLLINKCLEDCELYQYALNVWNKMQIFSITLLIFNLQILL